MRLIIAGGRDFIPYPHHWMWLDMLHDASILNHNRIVQVVCGMARGADLFGKEWAESYGIPVVEFPADWAKHGRAAGPIRNRQMAEVADAAVLFPGGNGTKSMHDIAKELGLTIYDWRERTDTLPLG